MKRLNIFLMALALLTWPLHSPFVWAAESQPNHQEHGDDEADHKNENHDEAEGHAHEDGHEHNDHGKEADTHDDHGHESHENEDPHDDHGHGDEAGHEEGGHDEYGEQGEHEEGKAEIAPESAERMGVVVEKAAAAAVDHVIPLTGRITLNENTKADVRARFPGIVRSVQVNLGERVEKGQVLAVIEANESLQDYNVTAPISGVILKRNTNIGDVANGEPLFMIADLSNVWSKFHVFPGDADYVQSGQTVQIHTLDDDKVATGKIDMLLPTADEISQTQIVIVVLPNPERIWKPGMTVEGDVTVSQKKAAVAVKESALQKMEELGDVIFIQEGNAFEPRPVELGRKGNGYVEIVEGLTPGELYVAEGSFIIKSDILKSTAAHTH